MATIEHEVQINAPPEKVFGYLSDLEKHPEWAHCDEVEKSSEGPAGVGATYRSRGKNLGITAKETVEVTGYQPNERFAWRATGAFGWKFGWSFEMKPQDDGTRLIERFDPPTGLVLGIILKLTESPTRKAMRDGLARIKKKLEAG